MDTLASSASPEGIARAAQEGGCRSVAFTYNDPTIFVEYAMDIAEACRELGIFSVAVTAGYIHAQPRRDFYPNLDALNVDLKAFTKEFYRSLCTASLDAVKDSLVYLAKETKTWFEVTTLLIPGHNDSDAEISAQCEWMLEHLGPEVPLHFSAFHPDHRMMDVPRTPLSTLIRARALAKKVGLFHVYTGNVHHEEGDTTWCSGCGEVLIVRDWYRILRYDLDPTGHCRKCGQALTGRFQESAGDFGRRRLRVHL
jgi:pyruvate formate lyase activating enzyme